jgi:hypothetical protein
VGNLHASVDKANLIESLNFWGEAAVNAENLALDHGANTEVVEDFSAVFPRVGVSVLSDSFIIETVDSCDLSCLVVSSEESDVSGIL